MTRILLNHSLEIANLPVTNTTTVFIDTVKHTFLKQTTELLRIICVILHSNTYMYKMGN